MYKNCEEEAKPVSITHYLDPRQTTQVLLDALPEEWRLEQRSVLNLWRKYEEEYAYPARKELEDNNESDKSLIGIVSKFDAHGTWGFIGSHYFYISQVCAEDEADILLRQLLYLGEGYGLEVSFWLGQNLNPKYNDKQPPATDIRLTERGLKDAQNRIASRVSTGSVKNGFVEYYDQRREHGRIQSTGKQVSRKYNFNLKDIVDPYLAAFYNYAFEFKEQDVTFECNGNQASNICWSNAPESDRSMFAETITEDHIKRWVAFQDRRRNGTRSMSLPMGDPYPYYPFESLPEPKDDSKELYDAPLTWETSVGTVIRKQESFPVKAMSSASKASHTLQLIQPLRVKSAAPEASLVSSAAQTDAKRWMEQGNRYSNSGDVLRARDSYLKALSMGLSDASVVNNLVMAYIRPPELIDEALRLLSQYEKNIPTNKLLNLKIQVYDKKKDYKALIPLYDEAFRTASSVTGKSHNLYRLIDAYMNTNAYEEALKACQRWEAFFQQNRFSSEASRVETAKPGIDRQKAVCLYRLNRTAEANEIAMNLIRSNPTDTVAKGILDGNLIDTSNLQIFMEDAQLDDLDILESGEESGDEMSEIPRFVRTLIQEASFDGNLRSPYLQDGRYTGSLRDAVRDANKMIRGRKFQTPIGRNESLLLAYKLLEQAEKSSNDTVRKYNKTRLIGRAMASWGDAMVVKCSQMDSPRMGYLIAIRFLRPNKEGVEQDWSNAYNRYLKSYFMGRLGDRSLSSYINQQSNTGEKDAANTDVFVTNSIPEVLLPDFLVGMLQMVHALDDEPVQQRKFLSDLYNRNPLLRSSLLRQSEIFMGQSVKDEGQESFLSYTQRRQSLLPILLPSKAAWS